MTLQAADPTMLALAGLRVLEIGAGSALAYAGKLFADFGAELIKVEHPGDQPWREMPPWLPAPADAGAPGALYAWLNTNKRSVTAGPGDAAWLATLARSCDLVLDGRALAEGLDALAAPVWAMPGAAAGPGPIEVVLTWFGEDGPYARYQGSEAVCRALAGAVHGSGPVEGPPHMPHELQTGIVAGLAAFSAALGALIGRDQGTRRCVLSVHEAVFGVVEMEAGMVQDGRHPRRRLGVNRFCGTHPAGIYETAAGWLGLFTHTLPQWVALCESLGRPDWARDPAFASGPLRMQRADQIDAWLGEALRTRSAAEWFTLLGERKHPAVLVPTMAELLQQAVHRERGAFVPVRSGDDAAAAIEGPVLPLRLGDAGPLPGGTAPAPGAHDAHYRGAGLARADAPAPRAAAAPDSLPLQGLRIVDLTMGWAGPLASRTAADLGAEVLKIESTSYPDWWRGANFTEEFFRDRLYEKNANFNLMNRHKLGVTLDLTQPEGRRLLLDLVARADAVIENYSAEVLPKLGLDYPALHAVNPRLVMVSMPAFGLDNAWSNTRAYGGTLEQASGLPLYTGHPDGPPAMTSYAYGDPIGGFNAGAALLLALYVQQRTGQGRHLNLSQVEGMLPLAAPWMLAQSASGAVPPRQGNRHALHAPHGCYACAGEDAWIVVSVRSDAAWQALCRVIERPDLAADPMLVQAAGRRAQAARLDQAVADWTRRHEADAAMATLQRAGVAAGAVRSIEQLLQDRHLHARGFWQPVTRAHVGTYLSSTPFFRLARAALPLRQVAPTLGEHTDAVLARVLGCTPGQLAALAQQGVTGRTAQRKPPAPSIPPSPPKQKEPR